MMLRTFCLALPILLVATAPIAVAAATIALDPSAIDGPIGGSFSLDIVVSGLGAAGAPSVAGYQIQLLFDPSLVLAQTVGFAPALGSGGQVLTSGLFGSGQVTLNAVSLLSSGALDALQGSEVTLATVTFERLSAASGSIDFGSVLLSDAGGLEIALTAATGTQVGTPIPEPSAALMYVLGMLVMGSALRSRRRTG